MIDPRLALMEPIDLRGIPITMKKQDNDVLSVDLPTQELADPI